MQKKFKKDKTIKKIIKNTIQDIKIEKRSKTIKKK